MAVDHEHSCEDKSSGAPLGLLLEHLSHGAHDARRARRRAAHLHARDAVQLRAAQRVKARLAHAVEHWRSELLKLVARHAGAARVDTSSWLGPSGESQDAVLTQPVASTCQGPPAGATNTSSPAAPRRTLWIRRQRSLLSKMHEAMQSDSRYVSFGAQSCACCRASTVSMQTTSQQRANKRFRFRERSKAASAAKHSVGFAHSTKQRAAGNSTAEPTVK